MRRGSGHLWRDAEVRKAKTGRKDEQHQWRRRDARQPDALGQPAVTFVVVLAPIGLRYQCVQPEQQADAEERGSVEDGIAQGHGADGRRPQFATMMVSTMPWATQPSSLNTTGTASATIAPSSCLHLACSRPMIPI